jgi:hypothetical protein
VAGGHGQQLQALPLEGRIAVGVLCQQPGGAGSIVADDRSPRPANLGDHLAEPGKILGIDLPKRLSGSSARRAAWSRSSRAARQVSSGHDGTANGSRFAN